MAERLLVWFLVVATLISLLAACFLGSTPLGIGRVVGALVGQGQSGDVIVVWQIRLPRALAAFIVGAALGASGAALQGLLRNPLADPGVLGVSATAVLTATVSIYYGLTTLSPWVLTIASIAGAMLATIIIAMAAMRTESMVTLILIGVGLSSFALDRLLTAALMIWRWPCHFLLLVYSFCLLVGAA